jgi:Protein of unknown function (DUF2853)
MPEDYLADVQKYAPSATEAQVKAIVKYLGIALQSKDASLVSSSDPSEMERVREKFLKKKLGLTDEDKALDKTLAEVVGKISGNKSRVTVYYLLAEKFNKLDTLA